MGRGREATFKAYCRILGREIPIEQVWAQPKQTSKKRK
jgi:hypothetical protein